MITRRVTVVSAHQGADRQMDLTEAQLDGLACVQCGVEFVEGDLPPIVGYVTGPSRWIGMGPVPHGILIHSWCVEDYRHPREAT